MIAAGLAMINLWMKQMKDAVISYNFKKQNWKHELRGFL